MLPGIDLLWSHHINSLLTGVQRMVHGTGKSRSTVPEFIKKPGGRIAALADSRKWLVDSVWKGADASSEDVSFGPT